MTGRTAYNSRQRITESEKKACWRIRIPLDEEPELKPKYPEQKRCLACYNSKKQNALDQAQFLARRTYSC